MKSLQMLLLALLLHPLRTFTQIQQPNQVSGHLFDHYTLAPLSGATVTLKSLKDSAYIKLTTTNSQGYFTLNAIAAGEYRLHISFVGYQQIYIPIILAPQRMHLNLDTIVLKKIEMMLPTVEIIEKRPPITVKRDTLEFNPEYFKTPENANLQQLLKKLPGVQIDENGGISINGKPVKRLLLDGLPYFIDDPRLAVTLQADLANRVQLIDAPSEKARLSGVVDGQKEKVINIIIKKDYKNTLTGNMLAGYGNDNYFLTKATLNYFRDNQQISTFGGENNVNDYYEIDQPATASNKLGINRTLRAGINYNNRINKKWLLSGNYIVSAAHSFQKGSSLRQNILPDTTYLYNQQFETASSVASHQLYLSTEGEIDSFYKFSAAIRAIYDMRSSLQSDEHTTLNELLKISNSGNIQNRMQGYSPKIAMGLSFVKRFHKKNRSASISFSLDNNIQKNQIYNQSYNAFIDTMNSVYRDTIQQQKKEDNTARLISVYLAYTEPLFKGNLMSISYSILESRNNSNIAAYDFNGSKNEYDLPNDSLSSNFNNAITTQSIGVSLSKQSSKFEYVVAASFQKSILNNIDKSADDYFRLKMPNLIITSSFKYLFNNSKQMQFMYYTSVTQPNIAQLQPVINNTNPLYVQLGNLSLKPSYAHNIALSYDALEPTTMRSFNCNIAFSVINNKIVSYSWLDTIGRLTTQPINTNGAKSIIINIANTFPLKKLRTFLSANTAIAYAHDINYLNSLKGYNDNLNVTQKLSFNYSVKELLSLSFETSAVYNSIRYSQQPNNGISFFDYNLTAGSYVNLPLSISLGSRISYWVNAGRASGYQANGMLLNAFISKTVFKKKQGTIKLQGFDLLNRNISSYRLTGPGYIEDVRSNVLERYFILSYAHLLGK